MNNDICSGATTQCVQPKKKKRDCIINVPVKINVAIKPSAFKEISEIAYDNNNTIEDTLVALLEENIDLNY